MNKIILLLALFGALVIGSAYEWHSVSASNEQQGAQKAVQQFHQTGPEQDTIPLGK